MLRKSSLATLGRFSRRRFVQFGGSAAAGFALIPSPLLPSTAVSEASSGIYLNPVIAGDHPDAGAIRVGGDYYLTHTTDSYTPGLLIWHSRDLVHWRAAAAALDRYYGEVWAPYLCEYNKRFYIYYPCNAILHVVYADHPLGPWSKPISLGIDGIDPAHIATPDGRRFLYMAGGSYFELATDGLSVKTQPKHVLNPWPVPESWRIQCICLEGPKLFSRNGYYYLSVAEGGTAGPPTSHMVLSARSRNVEGPWEWSPFNPIVHTRSAAEKWWSKGHGRPLEAVDGSWWMTLHAYENGLRTLGRQTLLLPLEWTHDGWFRVPAGISAGGPIPKAALEPARSETETVSFGHQLDLQWQFWKGFDPARVQLIDDTLTLEAQGSSFQTTSPLTRVAKDRVYTVEVEIAIEPGCEAGLLLFYDMEHVCGLRMSTRPHITDIPATTLIRADRATLRIVNDNQEADFFYRLDEPGRLTTAETEPIGRWRKLRDSIDVSCYNQNALGGFLDLRPAVYACGTGSATFHNWRYMPKALEAM